MRRGYFEKKKDVKSGEKGAGFTRLLEFVRRTLTGLRGMLGSSPARGDISGATAPHRLSQAKGGIGYRSSRLLKARPPAFMSSVS